MIIQRLLRTKKIRHAIEAIVDTSRESGFIEPDGESYILLTNSSIETNQDVEAELLASVFSEKTDDIIFETLNSDMDNYENALEQGISPGKRILVKKVKEIIESTGGNEQDKLKNITTNSNLGQMLKLIKSEEDVKSKIDLENKSDDKQENKKNETKDHLEQKKQNDMNENKGKEKKIEKENMEEDKEEKKTRKKKRRRKRKKQEIEDEKEEKQDNKPDKEEKKV